MKAKIIRIITKTLLYFFAISIGMTIIYRFVPPPITFLMVQRMLEQKMDGDKVKLKKDWVSIEHISPFMQRAAIASEDGHFMDHHGFDIDLLKNIIRYCNLHRC